ncbi:hypothetical protein ACFP3I_19345 [Chryseobacterium arachidis]|uniref:hypothetical protein n=1 Tax=Chryseobacterium arachidis TaxID=1416778 RepID=UPI003608AA59
MHKRFKTKGYLDLGITIFFNNVTPYNPKRSPKNIITIRITRFEKLLIFPSFPQKCNNVKPQINENIILE